jgi:hypothetical protein
MLTGRGKERRRIERTMSLSVVMMIDVVGKNAPLLMLLLMEMVVVMTSVARGRCFSLAWGQWWEDGPSL